MSLVQMIRDTLAGLERSLMERVAPPPESALWRLDFHALIGIGIACFVGALMWAAFFWLLWKVVP